MFGAGSSDLGFRTFVLDSSALRVADLALKERLRVVYKPCLPMLQGLILMVILLERSQSLPLL